MMTKVFQSLKRVITAMQLLGIHIRMVLDRMHAALQKHATPRGQRPRPATQVEIRRLRGWATVAESMEIATRKGLTATISCLTRRGGPLQPLFDWLPIIRIAHMPWGEVASLLALNELSKYFAFLFFF